MFGQQMGAWKLKIELPDRASDIDRRLDMAARSTPRRRTNLLSWFIMVQLRPQHCDRITAGAASR